jgi:hypothetical protein
MRRDLALIATGLHLSLVPLLSADNEVAERFFQQGVAAAKSGESLQAYHMFSQSTALVPASGTLHNLGNAAWRLQKSGPAVLAWEQALWIDPRNDPARTSLRYARHGGKLDELSLRWYEVCSSWLPASWWPWLASTAFWSAVGLLVLPPILRQRRRDLFQALAAGCAAIFLLCLPALAGLDSRAAIGFILPEEAPLRLTPTAEGQILTFLPSAEPGRVERVRGRYALVRTRYHTGWVEQNDIGLIGQAWSAGSAE